MFGSCASSKKVALMVAAMRRRGPDDSDIWTDGTSGLSLGHARLSIIDLSSAGHQPMILDLGHAGRLVIVFNGEIYNYKELRRELEAQGARFNTHSDTEVILWGWKIWGKETPKRLRGMFAFAIWDDSKKVLTLVRDRLGIKPLLWSYNKNGVIFGSSLKAMLASCEVPRSLNTQALYDYLLQGAVLQPRTMIKDVLSLEPGTMKEFKVSSKVLKCESYKIEIEEGASERYWRLERDEKMTCELAGMSYEDQVKVTRQKLEEACQYHLIADVPVGSFLSGGVDSTAITALMTRLSGEQIKSFSIGFSKETGMQDELSEARIAAQHIGTDHTEVVLTGKDVSDYFDDFIETLDQPSVDGLNTYWVSKVTRQSGTKVALSGLGGDEIFAGYDHFRWAFDKKPEGFSDIKGILGRMWLLLYRQLPYSRHPFEQCRHLMPLKESLVTLRRFMSEQQLQKCLVPEMQKNVNLNHLLVYADSLHMSRDDRMLQITQYECTHYLLNTLLRDADALSMGHGVEARPIFLDHFLVEHAFSLPATSKWRGTIPKAILKDATKDLLPANFFTRRKTGFTLPTHYWVEHELNEYYCDAIDQARHFNCFDQDFLKALKNNQGSKRIRRVMWQVLVLIQWMSIEKVCIE